MKKILIILVLISAILTGKTVKPVGDNEKEQICQLIANVSSAATVASARGRVSRWTYDYLIKDGIISKDISRNLDEILIEVIDRTHRMISYHPAWTKAYTIKRATTIHDSVFKVCMDKNIQVHLKD